MRKDAGCTVGEDTIREMIPEHFAGAELWGYKFCGWAVNAKDGVWWVESFQWKTLPDGSREPRRYRVVRMSAGGVVETLPFDRPGRVAEFEDERYARSAMTRIMADLMIPVS